MNAKLKTKHAETTGAIAAVRAEMGERLWKIAFPYRHADRLYKKDIAEKVRACKSRKQVIRGSKSAIAARDIVIEAAALLLKAWELKSNINHHAPRGLWHAVDSLVIFDVVSRHEQRLYKLAGLAEVALRDNYRTENVSVGWRKKIETWVDERKDWNFYSSRTRFPKIHHTLRVSLNRAWRDEVYRRGLMLVDGLFTIRAGKRARKDGASVFAASWLEQSRGYSLREAEGFIAQMGGVSYHAKTAAGAVRGVKKKIAIEAAAAEEARFLAAAAARREALLEKAAGVWVTFEDARATGACAPGIRSWCAAAGIDPAVGADGADVVAAHKRRADQRALLAVLHAMRRQRAQHASELDDLLA